MLLQAGRSTQDILYWHPNNQPRFIILDDVAWRFWVAVRPIISTYIDQIVMVNSEHVDPPLNDLSRGNGYETI